MAGDENGMDAAVAPPEPSKEPAAAQEPHATAVRSPVPSSKDAEPAPLVAYEPAPPNRSKKRKGRSAAPVPDVMVRLGEPVEKRSERLVRGRTTVRLSTEEIAPQILLDDSQLTASSSKGYRTVRCTHGAHCGTWYYEATIEKLGRTGAVRLGWSTRAAELQAPVGSDGLGYSYRSLEGSRVHQGVREDYGKGFGEGDVVGCMLHMPPGGRPLEKAPEDVVRYKGHLYFTEDETTVEAKPLTGSFMECFVNGESQGRTFLSSIREGTYYPAVSLYTHAQQIEPAKVTVNFGETEFKYPAALQPIEGPEGQEYQPRPACELPHAAPVDDS